MLKLQVRAKKKALSCLTLILFALVTILNANAQTNESSFALQRISELSGYFVPYYPYQDYLYAPGGGALNIISLQNSAYPHEVNSLSGVSGYVMAVGNQYAYLASGWSIIILDLSDPENPVPVNVYSDFEPIGDVYPLVEDVAIYGQTLYVSLDYFANRCPLAGKIAILDVSDPLNPIRVGTQEYPSDLGDIEVVGDKLLVLEWNSVLIFDLTNPAVPTWAGSFSFGPVYHDTARFWIAGEHAVINYGPVSYPCGINSKELSVLVDVSHLPATNVLFEEPGLDIKGYADGYLFTGGLGWLNVYRSPDFTAPAATFAETFYSFDILRGYLRAPEPKNFVPVALVTLRLSAISETVAPDTAHTLTYTDTLGVTNFELPAGSVLSPTVVSVLPLPKADYPPPGRFQRHAFDIRGHLPAEQLTLEAFQQPISATLPLPADPAAFPLGYDFLYWDGEQWLDAATTCGAVSSFPETLEFPGNSVGDNLIVSFCKPGKYALFVPVYDAFLPAVFR